MRICAHTHGRNQIDMKKYFIHTYGCQMNVHESEKLAGILSNKGYSKCTNENDADIVVYNTCCIRDTAERRALGNIGVIKGLKKQKPSLVVAVVGCMPQQDGAADSIREKYPYVDIVLGTRNIAMIADEIDKVLQSRANLKKRSDKKYRCFNNVLPDDYLNIDEQTPTLRTSYPNAWVNIIYGCNNFCSYCIVPYVRGRELSRSMNSVLDEVKRCVDEGYKEITLLGQNVNSYGNDLSDGTNFAKLLHSIDALPGKFRVRFMTSHPKDLTDAVIDEMAASDKICSNLHLPIQAGSDKVPAKAPCRHLPLFHTAFPPVSGAVQKAASSTDRDTGYPPHPDGPARPRIPPVLRMTDDRHNRRNLPPETRSALRSPESSQTPPGFLFRRACPGTQLPNPSQSGSGPAASGLPRILLHIPVFSFLSEILTFSVLPLSADTTILLPHSASVPH